MPTEILTLQRADALRCEGPVRSLRRNFASTALVIGLAATAASQAWAHPATESFADLAAEVSPAVVNISVEAERPAVSSESPEERFRQFSPDSPFRDFLERFFGDQIPDLDRRGEHPGPRSVSAGSGFIVDADGYVVTNNHVVAQADEITVTLSDGESYDATLVGGDERSDLALLKIEVDKSLPTVAFGDSDSVRPGDWVMAVGNPFGLGGTVTTGIVSARGRALPGGALIDYMQIDAPINRGNSGGPSFNVEGEVIGVNTAIFSPNGGSVGIGFAIPSKLAKSVVAELRETGFVERGWLGVQIQQVTPDIAEGLGLESPRGALVASLLENGPAEAAGLQAGDVILSWDGQAVAKMRDLPRLVADTAADKTVTVALWRDRAETTLQVTTDSMPDEKQQAAVSKDGLLFEGRPEILGRPYFRAFRHDGYWYALAMPGVMYRSRDGLTGFEEGPSLFNPNMRHSALLKRGDRLFVFWTERADAPERVWVASIDLSGDWRDWKASERVEVLRPERPWEGADLPVEPSRGGAINVPVNQLRDPAIFEEDGRVYFLYAVAGERGIALAEVHLEP